MFVYVPASLQDSTVLNPICVSAAGRLSDIVMSICPGLSNPECYNSLSCWTTWFWRALFIQNELQLPLWVFLVKASVMSARWWQVFSGVQSRYSTQALRAQKIVKKKKKKTPKNPKPLPHSEILLVPNSAWQFSGLQRFLMLQKLHHISASLDICIPLKFFNRWRMEPWISWPQDS